MPLSEHVDCVTIASKMTEWATNLDQICVELEHSSAETLWVIQKAAAMDNWWLVASAWQLSCSRITSHAEFSSKTSNHPGDSDPIQPRFDTLWLLVFPKSKMTFKREEISDCWWDQKNMMGSWWQLGEPYEFLRYLLSRAP